MFDPFPRSTKNIWVTKMDVGMWQGVCHWKQQPQQKIRKWVVNGLHRNISRRYNTVANHWLSWSIIPVCSVSAGQVTLRYPSEHFLIIFQIFLEILVYLSAEVVHHHHHHLRCSWLGFFCPDRRCLPFFWARLPSEPWYHRWRVCHWWCPKSKSWSWIFWQTTSRTCKFRGFLANDLDCFRMNGLFTNFSLPALAFELFGAEERSTTKSMPGSCLKVDFPMGFFGSCLASMLTSRGSVFSLSVWARGRFGWYWCHKAVTPTVHTYQALAFWISCSKSVVSPCPVPEHEEIWQKNLVGCWSPSIWPHYPFGSSQSLGQDLFGTWSIDDWPLKDGDVPVGKLLVSLRIYPHISVYGKYIIVGRVCKPTITNL